MTTAARLAVIALVAVSVAGFAGGATARTGGAAATAETAPQAAYRSAETGTPTATPTPAATRLFVDGEHLTVGAGPGQVIAGRTALPAGTTVQVSIRSTGGKQAFVLPARAVVDRHGRFRAVVDFSGVAPGAEFEVVVAYEDTRLASVTGRVVECTAACEEASPTAPQVGTTLATVGDRRPLARSAGSVVRGNTSLPAGTELTVRLDFDGAAPNRTTRVVVAADGSFRAVFDLSGVPEATSFRVLVRRNDRTLASAPGTVVECEGRCDWMDATARSTSSLSFLAPGGTPTGGGPLDGPLVGIGALVAGGLLAVVGIARLLGVGRS